MKKLIRTLEFNFPGLIDVKYSLTRAYRNFLNKPFESDFYALSLFPDSKDHLFLDIGANRGQSIDAILMQTQSGSIHSFEPNSLLFENLSKIYKNNSRVTVHNIGLGDVNTTEVLNIPFYKKWMCDGLGSFIEDGAGDWLKGRVYFYSEKKLSLKKIKAEIKRLDDFNFAPFFIKMDIQGFEYQALKGGIGTLKKHKPILLIETPDNNVVQFLEELGYVQYAFSENKFIPHEAGYLNSFFMTNDKSDMVKKDIQM